MRRRAVRIGLILALVVAAGVYYALRARQPVLALTGIVTTDDVIVSAQVAGRIAELAVEQGQTVTANQRLAVIAPDELRADSAYYGHVVDSSTAGIQQNQAAVRLQRQQMDAEVHQAEASVAAAEASQAAASADLDNARLVYQRSQQLYKGGLASSETLDQARTAFDSSQARVRALERQTDAARAALALERANAEQVLVREGQLAARKLQRHAVVAAPALLLARRPAARRREHGEQHRERRRA